ncbi:hypothetical protein SLEP1_g27884 [Rubroshorea leprosula]|uniref:Disease resistance protein RGA3 n=1 Tax=Rubroshorea leprosula TaxID=152421 RepID=A0AAV5K169_9ROSI|nr:hypothetical protein SLEP1_g27884 [Rubroshorea leprosula]
MDPQWADLLLSPIINTTISKLISTAAEQISLAVGWKKELASLKDKLILVQAVLKDAEEKQVSDPAVKLWLERLRDVVYEADDVLDEVAYESVKCKVETKNQKMKWVCNFFTSSNPLLFHRKISEKIKNIIASVDVINNEARGFGLQIRLATACRVVSEQGRNPQTHSTIGDLSEVVGREDDVSKIVHLLTDLSDVSRLCVLSIVGMPGLGKTTLAQAVRNDEQIKNYFGKIMWVCVSDDFDVKRILTEMLESLTGNSCAVKNKDTVIQKIRDAMGENNFLLVLDDMWDEESHRKFEDLRSCLLGICKNPRNRVIVTTRDEKVALKMGMHDEHMHHLGKLQDAHCWSIIRKTVFGDASIPSEFENIGWDIAQLCGGVPLVASVIGGTLSTRRLDRVEWLSFKSKIEALGSVEHDIEIRDFVMEREMLIQLWMAKGFLQSAEESPMTMEDIEWPPCFGNMKNLRYLDISRTRITKLPKFIPKLYQLQTFRFTTCRSLEMPPEGIGSLINLRHIYFSDEEQMPANIGKLMCLQTLPKFFVGTTKGCKIEELGSLRCLRGSLKICNLEHVKDKSEAMGAKLYEKTISELRLRWGKESNRDEDVLEGLQPHSDLQVLEIHGYGGKNLSSWMSKNVMNCDMFLLKNLVELRIVQCKNIIADGGFAKLASLKELRISDCPKLERVSSNGLSLPQSLLIPGCKELSSLSTSTCLKVLSLDECQNLRSIPSLRGLSSLEEIRLCSKLRSIPENTLNSLTNLKKLAIGGFSEELEEFPGLSSLQASLERLDLIGWGKLTEFPLEIQNPNLTALNWLSIDDFKEVETLPKWLGNLSSLKSLWIRGCLRLKYLPSGLSFFPTLERLIIVGCPNLVSANLEEILGGLARLKILWIGLFSEELEEFPSLSSIHNLGSSLEYLALSGWAKLTQLPHQIQHLTALRILVARI